LLVLEVQQDVSDDLFRHLAAYRLRSKVTIQKTAEYAAVMYLREMHEHNLSPDPRSKVFGFRKLVSTSSHVDGGVIDSSGLYKKVMHMLGFGEGSELMGKIPLEMNLDLLHYISFTKGCYIGQELVARAQFKVKSSSVV
jgi:folate-binding protein YgfZ